MIQTQRCPFYGCNGALLENMDELDTGLCGRHINEIEHPDYLTLSCWSCEGWLETYRKTSIVEGVEIKDNYIFSKECPICSEITMSNLQYVTMNSKTEWPYTEVRDDGVRVTASDKATISREKVLD